MIVVEKSGKNKSGRENPEKYIRKSKSGKVKSGNKKMMKNIFGKNQEKKKSGKGQVWRKKDQGKICSNFINRRRYKQVERLKMRETI
jgi:hypothetical protein